MSIKELLEKDIVAADAKPSTIPKKDLSQQSKFPEGQEVPKSLMEKRDKFTLLKGESIETEDNTKCNFKLISDLKKIFEFVTISNNIQNTNEISKLIEKVLLEWDNFS